MNYQDYSALDIPDLLQIVFHPRKDFTPPPQNSTDHLIPVEGNVSISCRFYVRDQDAPSILFFHGNGEVSSDYDYFAPLYNESGINLFVADYRGYGSSGGMPTFSNTIHDAHRILKGFQDVLKGQNYNGKFFVMGRSLGSISAIELASHYQKQINGLIIESGIASELRMLARLGFSTESLGITNAESLNLARVRSITSPILIIHGEYDSMIPLDEAKDLYENVATEKRDLVIIPGADHNDLMLVGMQLYFEAIREFVFGWKP